MFFKEDREIMSKNFPYYTIIVRSIEANFQSGFPRRFTSTNIIYIILKSQNLDRFLRTLVTVNSVK